MSTAILPIFICVVLPVAIVLINAINSMHADNKQAEILIKAIEANNNIDANKLAESLSRPQKTAREILNLRLLRGCIFSLIGIALVIVGLINFATGTGFSADPVTVPMVFGGASLAIGISYMIVYFVTRNNIQANVEKNKQ